MSITFNRARQRWQFQFERTVTGRRQRTSKLLPKGWDRAQAQEYDRIETARLAAFAAGLSQPEPLIEAAVLLYLQEHAHTLKNFKGLRSSLALMLPAYAGQPMSQLANVARAYASAQAGAVSPSTIRNRLAYLRAACRWAWKVHQLGEADPAARMQLPPAAKGRQVYLSREQMLHTARQMQGLSGQQAMRRARAAMRIAFYSGMRLGEVLSAKVVQTEGGAVFELRNTKNGEDRLVPIHPRIAHIVRNRALWPIALHESTVSHYTKRALQAAGLGHARLHDLRHSTASAMINAGVDLYTVGGVLGHKSPVSTQRYAHLATASLRAALGKVGASKGKNSRTNPEAKAA
jgi:integrase